MRSVTRFATARRPPESPGDAQMNRVASQGTRGNGCPSTEFVAMPPSIRCARAMRYAARRSPDTRESDEQTGG